MNWLIFALLAPLCFAVVNHIDSHLVKKVSTTGSLVLFSGFFGFIVAIVMAIIALASGFSLGIGTLPVVMLIISGALEIIWLIFYMKALETDHVASVALWFQLVPVVVAILAFIFLGEKLGWIEIGAGILILVGTGIVAYDWGESFRFKKREAMLMTAAVLIVSVGYFLFKAFAIEEPSFWVASFWMSLGMGVAACVMAIYRPYRNEFKELLKKNTGTVLSFNVANEILNAIALLSVSYAGLLTALAHVHTVATTQPVFVLIIALVIALIQKDRSLFNKKKLIPLVVALILMTIGAIVFARAQ